MKRVIQSLLILLLTLPAVSCLSLVTDNIDARANLAKCKYTVVKIEPIDLTLTNKKLVDEVSFDVYVKIENTSPSDVALDRIDGKIYLDKTRMADLGHKRFLKIKKGDSATEPFRVTVPFRSIMAMKSGRPKEISVKATLWVNLLVGGRVLESDFSVNLEYSTPIPYDKINKMAEKKIKELAREKAGEAVDTGVDKIKDLF